MVNSKISNSQLIIRNYFCFMDDNFKPLPKNNGLEPDDFYYTPEGYIVFTEKYHLKRGHCCKSGCRHCPYGYDKKTDSFKK